MENNPLPGPSMQCLISACVSYCSFYVRQKTLSKLIIKTISNWRNKLVIFNLYQNLDGYSSEKKDHLF